ncbi:MAG: tetratricopeptide repeat protein [Cryomorphaceae bacterium]|nr:tetratricopeptide repeat protein [Cryomorphaceae bacterium]
MGIKQLIFSLVLLNLVSHHMSFGQPVEQEQTEPMADKASLRHVMEEGNAFYESSEYELAVEKYTFILSQGIVSSEVYFNLGNAYFKKNNLGKAILNYERALKLAPKDEDIQFNLEFARASTVDKIESTGTVWFKKMVHGYLKTMNTNAWAMVSLVLVFLALLFWILFLSNRYAPNGLIIALVVSLLLAIAAILSSFGRRLLEAQRFAIVMDDGITVKSAPAQKGEDMFIIHEGTKMELLDEYQTWFKIRLENGNVGWLPQNTVEEI